MTDPARTDPHTTIIDLVETGLVALLKERLPFDAFIDVFPDNPADFDLANLTLVALVQYTGSAFTPTRNLPQGAQGRALGISIHSYARDLRGPKGGYRLMEAVRLAVQGERAGPSGQIDVLSDGLVEERGAAGFYHFETRIACPVQAVAARQQPRPRTVAEKEQMGAPL